MCLASYGDVLICHPWRVRRRQSYNTVLKLDSTHITHISTNAFYVFLTSSQAFFRFPHTFFLWFLLVMAAWLWYILRMWKCEDIFIIARKAAASSLPSELYTFTFWRGISFLVLKDVVSSLIQLEFNENNVIVWQSICFLDKEYIHYELATWEGLLLTDWLK